MPGYFGYFPSVKYEKRVMLDITKRVRFQERFADNPYIFLPYTVEQDDRPEDVAYLYYGTTDYTWMIYLANNIIDPYHDWPKSPNSLDDYIAEKYILDCGLDNISNSIFNDGRVKFALYVDAINLGINPDTMGIYDENSEYIVDYIRNNTTHPDIVQVGNNFRNLITSTSYDIDHIAVTEDELETIFNLVGDFVDYVYGENDNTGIQSKVVELTGKESLEGEFDVLSWTKSEIYRYTNENDDLISKETYDMNIGANPLDPDFEASDWTPITIYDREESDNEDKRQIYLVDIGYAPDVAKEMKDIF